jgi:hypothetical protein
MVMMDRANKITTQGFRFFRGLKDSCGWSLEGICMYSTRELSQVRLRLS